MCNLESGDEDRELEKIEAQLAELETQRQELVARRQEILSRRLSAGSSPEDEKAARRREVEERVHLARERVAMGANEVDKAELCAEIAAKVRLFNEEQQMSQFSDSSEDDGEEGSLDAAAKKSAIKAALAAKRAALAAKKGISVGSNKSSDSSKKKSNKDKSDQVFENTKGTGGPVKNYLQAVSWKTQVGPKTHIAKP